MINVLFICLGNICRSPMAQAVFQQLVDEQGFSTQIAVDSAGTAGYHIGARPDRRTLEVLAENQMATDHLGRKLSKEDFETYDYIAVMDSQNFDDVHRFYYDTYRTPPPPNKVFLIRDYDPEVRGPQDVPDPYYEDKKAFRNVFEMLKRSCQGLLDKIIDTHQLEPHFPETDKEVVADDENP